MEEDQQGLSAFKECLMNPNVALTSVDLMYNRIGKLSACCPALEVSSVLQTV
jgi:hypothetical protein